MPPIGSATPGLVATPWRATEVEGSSRKVVDRKAGGAKVTAGQIPCSDSMFVADSPLDRTFKAHLWSIGNDSLDESRLCKSLESSGWERGCQLRSV